MVVLDRQLDGATGVWRRVRYECIEHFIYVSRRGSDLNVEIILP